MMLELLRASSDESFDAVSEAADAMAAAMGATRLSGEDTFAKMTEIEQKVMEEQGRLKAERQHQLTRCLEK
ncbi:hypothetical protein PC116_g59 [Phytophthora cactorum]|uniref:Uncharacterized protein n=1 Tax=Phytophthora cactorum TaxID=29920 RepID=A0A8T1A070_9STRA|nr:hypothetical protein Pcac1_g11014 [Phytophthora cactorum]KAG2847814.1 hypothetical protein PC111_g709 [Phytophthora cactorum]KAG2849764.1 hypothetical protein PC112_g57 [Phytophthora cactorum]KAG2869323.1 hypothetical protein PC113_g308 [Phytophthora cactorum]KAG2936404.1 hypothetical protein PC114_g263 [Phytophthora cactorum]